MKNKKYIYFFLSFLFLFFLSCKNKDVVSERPDENREISERKDSQEKDEVLLKTSDEKRENEGSVSTDMSLQKEREIRIFYFGSWEAVMRPISQGGSRRGGLPYLAAFLKKNRDPQTLICCTGDFFSGDAKDKRPVVPALNAIGLSVTTLGNLDFNYGPKELKKQLSQAKFEVLSGNVYKDEEPLFSPYAIQRIGETRIGIIGITTQEATIQVPPEMIKELKFKDPMKEVQKTIQELKGKADILILLSNQRHEEDLQLAANCPELALIIGRYDMAPDHLAVRQGPVFIVRNTKKHGTEVGEVVLSREEGKWAFSRHKVYDIGPEIDGIPPDPESENLVVSWENEEKELSERLCETMVKLEGEYENVRQRETNLGNLVADILLEHRPGSDISILNSGCIRGSIDKGEVTYRDLMLAFPYKNHLVELTLKGEIIKDVLETSVANYEKISGAFLQVGGLSFAFDTTREKFSRVTEIDIQGEPLDRQREYRVVTLDYLASGGDDYVMLKDKPVSYTSQETLQMIVKNYMKKRNQIVTGLENRIRKID